MNPAVSIVVPIYNVEKYLDRCISSIQTQTLQNIEIILVDDESPDSCPELCELYKEKDSRIRVVHKKNGGLGVARNTGIEVAHGEYIAFIDSDDYIESNMLEVLYEKGVATGADAVISGGFKTEYVSGSMTVSQDVEIETTYAGNTRVIPLKMMGARADYPRDYEYEMSACKGIYRLQLLNEHNVRFHSERELISEDLKFHLDFFSVADKAVMLPEIFYHYCENEVSLTKIYDERRFLRNAEFYNYMIVDLQNMGYDSDCKDFADRMLLARARVAIGQVEKHYQKYNKEAREAIKSISDHETLRQILSNYPIAKLPIKQRLFVYALKNKWNRTLYFLVRANNVKNR